MQVEENAPLATVSEYGLELLRWFEAQPGWAKLGRERREMVAHLCLNEADEELSTLTSRPYADIAADSFLYSRNQISNLMKAMRRLGLIVTKQQFVDSERGYGRRQAGSLNYRSLGAEHVPSEKRQDAARRGVARKTPPRLVGRVPFTKADDAQVWREVRNRVRYCEHCGNEFLSAKPWHRFCSSACRKKAHRAG